MSYTSSLEVSRVSGLGLAIVDEVVGTGDNSNDDFDLDQSNIVAGSYVLSYAASDSNNFTALTETTHYTLDKNSGRILLTATGVTALGTNILYASYTYIEKFSDTVISSFITNADAEVDKLTGKSWGTSTSYTEYIDGRERSGYPTTDAPYQVDWDEPEKIMLSKKPVIQVDRILFLDISSISSFFNYDDNVATYTDYTDNVNNSDSAEFTLFASTPAINDIVYIGCGSRFLGLNTSLNTVGTGSPAIDWEYWNGSSWSDISETEVNSGASTFTSSGRFTWSIPANWTKCSVNSSNSLYFIRGKLTSIYTIAPIVQDMAIYDVISDVVHPRDYVFRSIGYIELINKSISNGTQNIRVDYKYGLSSTPTLIGELSAILVAKRCYVNITGGSYDDATSYTLGSKAVTIGEVYVNVREVLDQLDKRKEEIIKLYGKRATVVA
jgi:hypothetical protein